MNFECTPWFFTDEQPARSGVYELGKAIGCVGPEPVIGSRGFAYFDLESGRWLQPRASIEAAIKQDALIHPPEGVQPYGLFWRGLLTEAV